MSEIIFPPLESASPDGLVGVSYEINNEYLLSAYSQGIFPWPFDDELIPWVSPPLRAILEFDRLKIPKSLPRFLKKQDFQFRINSAFPQVIRACATVKRKAQDSSWINRKIIDAYCEFNRAGYAMSFETFDSAGLLVGGLYGVRINNYFAGESMFFLKSGASKFALLETIKYLNSQGLTWLDAQVMTPLLYSFGAEEIKREQFLEKLGKSI